MILFGARQPGEDLRGLRELVVRGLPDGDAGQLLSSVLTWPLDARLREQIVAETRGNPLALLELNGRGGAGGRRCHDQHVSSHRIRTSKAQPFERRAHDAECTYPASGV